FRAQNRSGIRPQIGNHPQRVELFASGLQSDGLARRHLRPAFRDLIRLQKKGVLHQFSRFDAASHHTSFSSLMLTSSLLTVAWVNLLSGYFLRRDSFATDRSTNSCNVTIVTPADGVAVSVGIGVAECVPED